MDSAHSGNLASQNQFQSVLPDPEEGARGDGGSHYFSQMPQDEGTGGESYNQQNSGAMALNHYQPSAPTANLSAVHRGGLRRPMMMNPPNGE
jgi:hypothetical protein